MKVPLLVCVIFCDTIDYSKVKIKYNCCWIPKNCAVTINNTIYSGSCDIEDRLLLHEMMHIHQFQHHNKYLLYLKFIYTHLFLSRKPPKNINDEIFWKLNLEQQAEAVEGGFIFSKKSNLKGVKAKSNKVYPL